MRILCFDQSLMVIFESFLHNQAVTSQNWLFKTIKTAHSGLQLRFYFETFSILQNRIVEEFDELNPLDFVMPLISLSCSRLSLTKYFTT